MIRANILAYKTMLNHHNKSQNRPKHPMSPAAHPSGGKKACINLLISFSQGGLVQCYFYPRQRTQSATKKSISKPRTGMSSPRNPANNSDHPSGPKARSKRGWNSAIYILLSARIINNPSPIRWLTWRSPSAFDIQCVRCEIKWHRAFSIHQECWNLLFSFQRISGKFHCQRKGMGEKRGRRRVRSNFCLSSRGSAGSVGYGIVTNPIDTYINVAVSCLKSMARP